MKGFILAAGFGTRLWPLTEDRTKAAIPFLNRPLINYAVEYLASYGIRDIIVNLHHQPESIRAALGDGSKLGVKIEYSLEDEILGTSGALDRVRESLLDDDFVVINGKIVTNIDLGKAIAEHRKQNAIATLVLRENAELEHFSTVEVDERGLITRFAGFPASSVDLSEPVRASRGKRPKVFLSYARENEREVHGLYVRLLNAGFNPWMDAVDIIAGEVWEVSVDKAIRESDFFVPCVSRKSLNKRGFLQKELGAAFAIWEKMLSTDIFMIPVRLEECDVQEGLRLFQWVDLFREDGFSRLVRGLQEGARRRSVSSEQGAFRVAPLMFTGIQVLSPRILDFVPRGCFSHSTIHVYPRAIAAGEQVVGHISNDDWHEMSTLRRYVRASLNEIHRRGMSIITGTGCSIGPRAVVRDSVLWDGAVIEGNAVVQESVLGDGVRIPSDTIIDQAIVVRRDIVGQIERGEVVGDNLIVPI